ncbi:MAG: hypothetical protein ACK4GN_08730 [Runella sp.]
MTSIVQSIYEQFRSLPEDAKNEFLAIISKERKLKEIKVKQRILAVRETDKFFECISEKLPSDYLFDRELANER